LYIHPFILPTGKVPYAARTLIGSIAHHLQEIEKNIKSELPEKIVMLTVPRQAGKTTL